MQKEKEEKNEDLKKALAIAFQRRNDQIFTQPFDIKQIMRAKTNAEEDEESRKRRKEVEYRTRKEKLESVIS